MAARRGRGPLSAHSTWAWSISPGGARPPFAARRPPFAAPWSKPSRLTDAVVRRCSLQQLFWTSLMVALSALSTPGARRLELGENRDMPHVDTGGALKPCPQAHFRAGTSGRPRNRSARPCEYLKEDALRWGAGSFFTRAPLRARAFAPVCASLSHLCVSVRLRIVLAMYFECGRSWGLHPLVLFEADRMVCGS